MTLKIAYKKLWLLLNLGCVFVGHGLSKDFRTLNLHVPKPQVIDTSDLFFQRRDPPRKLSLRFLAWYFLKEDIQTGDHDSIEDARTALRLWRQWQRFEDEGVAEQKVEDVYRDGKQYNFKPPGEFEAHKAALRAGRRVIQSVGGGGSSTDLGLLGAGRMTPELGGSGTVTPVSTGKWKGKERDGGGRGQINGRA